MIDRIPLNAVTKWSFETLDAARSTWNPTARVYDAVPENAGFPYVEIGDFEDENTEDKVVGELRVFQRINIISGARGYKEVNQLVAQAVQAIDDAVASPPVDLDDDFALDIAFRESFEATKQTHPVSKEVVRVGVVRFLLHVRDKLAS